MPTETQQPFDPNELLNDVRYVNKANKEEIRRLKNEIRRRIAEADSTGTIADAVLNEVSKQLGQLSVKVKLTEKAIYSINSNRAENSRRNTVQSHSNSIWVESIFEASQFARTRNFLPIESSGKGASHVWSGPDPEISFEFQLDRSKTLGMQIRLFALIKPEYSKQLRVLVDGQYIKHLFTKEASVFVVSCVLPPSNNISKTEVKIILPGTHSPKELGDSQDSRKLGVAICDIRFGKPDSAITRLLKRLRLK